ncbi:MAG: ankyrin repeat domain-containing protein [Bryobacteraceae bacterium]
MAALGPMPAGEISVGLLLNSIGRGDCRGTRDLLKANPSPVRAKAPDGASAVLLAVYCGHPEMVPLFVEHGARLDFFEACAARDQDRALALVEADPALIRQFSPDGYHGLGLAVFFGHQDLAEHLLARRAHVNTASANPQKVAAIHAAAARSNVPMIRMLLSKGANVNAVQPGGFTPLDAAAFHGSREIVEMLLAHGADPARKTAEGKTAADLAAEHGHREVTEQLRR